MGRASKSPWIIHYDASSCNGCDIEVLATLCPGYDAERFGIINTGNPKHADIFLVTGSVNMRNINVIKEIYDQMLEPKVVVACGVCACSGGVFRDCYNVIGGVDKAIPVDVYAPGCAVRPEAIIDAVIQGTAVLDEKSKAFKDGTLPIKPGNDWLTDEEYEAQKERELSEEDGTEAFEKEYE
ncbi:MAG: NADH-quinone oxidoreductase subunit NuoB, partial [Eggerthellaceae bacterium]|nr:NADH-quinone oxidoreductase subunit NuoB [Eggerthellaceae bacterium]